VSFPLPQPNVRLIAVSELDAGGLRRTPDRPKEPAMLITSDKEGG
jgi:hypothetical protein